MALRTLVEMTPRLELGALRKAGLFSAAPSVVVQLINSELAVRAILQPDRSAIRLEWFGGVQMAQIMPLTWRRVYLGHVPLFDPEGRKPCTSIYLHADGFHSREALGLAYGSQRMTAPERIDLRLTKATARLAGEGGLPRARGKNRARLLGALRARSDRLDDAGWAILDEADARARARCRRRPLRSDSALSTRWALLRGRTGEPRFTSAEVLRQLLRPSSLPADAPEHPPSGLGLFRGASWSKSGACELDVRAITPRPGRARGCKLAWGSGPQGRVVLAAVTGDGAARRLRLEIWTGDGVGVARQEIATTTGRRAGDLFLVCPVTARRVLKVYLRDGRFASAQAQRLR